MSTHPLFPDEPMEPKSGFPHGKKQDDRTTFDLVQGELAKDKGIERASEPHAADLDMARTIARQIATDKGEVSADDVQLALKKVGYELLGKSAGSLFRTKEWIFTGRWRKSPRVSNHGHENRIWRLR